MAFPHDRGTDCMSGYLNPDYLYGTYTSFDDSVWATRWHEPTDTYESIDLATVASNHLELPLVDPTDTHYASFVGVDDQDDVFVFANQLVADGATTTHGVVCTNVAAFTNPASWSAVNTSHYEDLPDTPGDTEVYTYHLFERMTDGTLLHFLSQNDNPGGSRNMSWLAFKRRSGTWSSVVTSNEFFATTDGTGADRIYVDAVHVLADGGGAGVDRVLVFSHWRTGGTDGTTSQAPFILYSDHPDLGAWRYFQVAGPGYGTQTMPITWATRANAEIDTAPAWSFTYSQTIYTDDSGNPSVIARINQTADYVRLTWDPTTGWVSAAVDAGHGSDWYDFRLDRERWVRKALVNAVALRRESDGRTVRLGGTIPTANAQWVCGHDPVWLRERDIFTIVVPDGQTPLVWTWGNTARLRTA